MNIDKQIDQAFRDVFLAASAFALAVILGHSTLTSLDSSKAIVERSMQFERVSHVVPCDTDTDCMIKNPHIDPDNFMNSEE